MTPHLIFVVGGMSQVNAAQRAAGTLAAEAGMDASSIDRIAVLVTQLGTNLWRHSTSGRLLIAMRRDGEHDGIDVLSLDDGPGMIDPDRCMADGYSTSGDLGNGLGEARRLSDEFSLFSVLGRGTVIFGRVVGQRTGIGLIQEPRFVVGAVCLAAPGESVSGDGWSFRAEDETGSLMVADGLGHGPGAAEAAEGALAVFKGGLTGSPSAMLTRAHQALHGTVGAVVAVATFEAKGGTIVFSGAGNITGRLISGIADRTLLSQPGTVGRQIRRLHDVSYEWDQHAVLVVHSDGLFTRWKLDDVKGVLLCHPAVIAGWLVREWIRGRDDVTVVVVRRHAHSA